MEMIKIEAALLIVIGILIFELIIFVHEGGHCIAAKLSGVKVNEFALGMGPKLFSFKKGETTYSFRILPIGGFCSMEGEDSESSDERAFINKPVWKRMIIVLAGAIMNILLGLIMTMIVLAPNEYFGSTQIAKFTENATTSQQLKVDDRFVSINGYKTYTTLDMSFALQTAKENDFDITVERNGEYKQLQHVKFPTVKKTNDKGEENEIIQIDFKIKAIDNNFGTLLQQTGLNTISTLKMVWSSLLGLVTGQFGLNEISGPVGMTSAVSQVTAKGLETGFKDGLLSLINVMTIITINLGIVNLLPLPALDGGRFVFLLIEAICRKPIDQKYEGYIHAGGMVLLLLFMLAITIKDIIQFFL